MAIIHPYIQSTTVLCDIHKSYIILLYYNYNKYTYSAGMKERCRDGCKTSLLIAGVVLVPAIFILCLYLAILHHNSFHGNDFFHLLYKWKKSFLQNEWWCRDGGVVVKYEKWQEQEHPPAISKEVLHPSLHLSFYMSCWICMTMCSSERW